MTESTQLLRRSVRRQAVARLGWALGGLLSTLTAGAATSAAVVAVEPAAAADLVLLSHGFDAGLRPGMVCRITRGNTQVAEILLVDLRPTCSAALILSLAPRQAIRPGDLAAIKVLKS